MHAYLIVGDREESLIKANELAVKLKTKILEFPLNKIADTRELRKITKLTFNTLTAIFVNSIDLATEEALNAFLKNLEEPQENIYYILTASNLRNVIPTIASRCEIIKLPSDKQKSIDTNSDKFLRKSAGEKLAFIDRIKDREEAKEFVQNLIEASRFNLLNSKKGRLKTVSDLEILLKTLNNLKSNGNVGLQLSNMTIGLNQCCKLKLN
jgi:DNA polymerase III delta prime subunit